MDVDSTLICHSFTPFVHSTSDSDLFVIHTHSYKMEMEVCIIYCNFVHIILDLNTLNSSEDVLSLWENWALFKTHIRYITDFINISLHLQFYMQMIFFSCEPLLSALADQFTIQANVGAYNLSVAVLFTMTDMFPLK